MSYYRTCPRCGATPETGEKCTCNKETTINRRSTNISKPTPFVFTDEFKKMKQKLVESLKA
jgi:hypothetical protein